MKRIRTVLRKIKPIVNKAKNLKEAEEWDILQQIQMRPEERQKIAKKLKERVFGKNPPDVRSQKS